MKIVENDQYTLISVEKSSFNELNSIVHDVNSNHILIELHEDILDVKNKITFFLKTALDLKAKNLSLIHI